MTYFIITFKPNSTGEVSLISECKSVRLDNGDNVDVDDDGKDAAEVKVY